MFYVYILSSLQNGTLYVGSTKDLKRRVKEHNSGQNYYTKRYKPWKLIFYEAHLSESDMFRREKYLKTTQGKRALKRMLRDYFSNQTSNFENQGSTT